jgi:predicted Zn-dependent protease
MLEPPDSHYLRAAEGWLELGNCVEAGAELDQIALGLRINPAVLEMRCRVFTVAKQWEGLIEASAALIAQQPQKAELYVRHANALFFLGRTAEARSFVLPLINRFPDNAILQYNLACYECQLGNFDDSKFWLIKSIVMNKTLWQFARQDPDLAPFWRHFTSL